MRYTNKKIRVATQINTAKEYYKEGLSLQETLRQYRESNQEIEDVELAPEIFQERKDGVDPMCDIRTDKMQLAQDACDTITRTHLLARANKQDMGKKPQEEFTYVTDTNGNIVENPNISSE